MTLLESLIEQLQDYEFRLIGTARDSIVCDEITNGLNSERVKNLSGKTDLVSLCSVLSKSKCLVCNDSGAMHIANSIGVPVYAVFGVTNSEVTGPVFSHFKKIYNSSELGSSDALSKLLKSIVIDQKYIK